MIWGIDNGLDGAAVALSEMEGLPPIAKFSTPCIERHYPARSKKLKARNVREIDSRSFFRMFMKAGADPDKDIVYFEECPWHADQALIMRSMAISAGKILTILELKGFTVKRVFSYDWQPVMLGDFKKGQSKIRAFEEAQKIWPSECWMKSEKSIIPDDGHVDAALIAEYGRLQESKPNTKASDA